MGIIFVPDSADTSLKIRFAGDSIAVTMDFGRFVERFTLKGIPLCVVCLGKNMAAYKFHFAGE